MAEGSVGWIVHALASMLTARPTRSGRCRRERGPRTEAHGLHRRVRGCLAYLGGGVYADDVGWFLGTLWVCRPVLATDEGGRQGAVSAGHILGGRIEPRTEAMAYMVSAGSVPNTWEMAHIRTGSSGSGMPPATTLPKPPTDDPRGINPARSNGTPYRWLRLLPLLVAVPTVLLALVVMLGWRFDGLYGQDPYAYFDYGTVELRHSLVHLAGLMPMVWPLGYPLLITILSLALGASTVAGQAASLMAGIACVALTYLLGRDLLRLPNGAETTDGPATFAASRLSSWRGPTLPSSDTEARIAAIVGAVALGVAGWMVEASVMIVPDSLAVAMSLLGAWALVRWARDSRRASPWWAVLAGAALGWSIVTRWGQMALLPVWLLVLLPAVRAGPIRFVRPIIWMVIPLAAIVGAQLWLAFAVPPGHGLGSHPFIGDFGLVNGGGWTPQHLFQRDFLNGDGAQHYSLPNAVFYATAAFRPKYLTPLVLPLVVLGLWRLWSRHRRPLQILLLVGWPVAVLLLDAGLAQQNIRFVLPAVPPIALLAGIGAAQLYGWFASRYRMLLFGALAAVGLVVAGAGMVDMQKVVAASQTDRQTVRWTAARVPPGSVTITFEITETLSHSTRLHPLDLSVLSTGHLRRLDRTRRVYLLVDVPHMEGQWLRRPPGRHYRFLRQRIGLTDVGRRNGYTLFRLHRP